jgi:hypothetical protein
LEKAEDKLTPQGEEIDIYANDKVVDNSKNSKWVKKFITINKYNEKL